MQIDSPKLNNILENAALQKVPAISAAVISKDSDLYKGHFGFKDLENKNPVDDNTLYRIASMTKAITSTCIYQLIDKDDSCFASTHDLPMNLGSSSPCNRIFKHQICQSF